MVEQWSMQRKDLYRPRRRAVLRAVAGGAIAGVAGCNVLRSRRLTRTTETAKLVPADGDGGEGFGDSIALADDGDTALIGAPGDEDSNGHEAGAAYVFKRAGGAWTEVTKLAPADGAAENLFGISAALAGDSALIGALDEDPDGPQAGAAYVFERMSDGWAEAAKLTPTDGEREDDFGTSVALSDDGTTALVGSEDEDSNGEDAGAVYVFEGTTKWTETAKFTPADGEKDDAFGWSVALGGDTALVGAPGDEDPNGLAAGTAYVFERANDGWTEAAKLVPTDGESLARFGHSITLVDDTVLVGAVFDSNPNGNGAGAAYVFEQTGNGWTEAAKLTPTDGDAEDTFGRSVAFAVDGDTALIGATEDEDHNGVGAGTAYLFERTDSEWTNSGWTGTNKFAPDDGNHGFGGAVAFRDGTALIGASEADNSNGEDAGAVYVFDLERTQ